MNRSPHYRTAMAAPSCNSYFDNPFPASPNYPSPCSARYHICIASYHHCFFSALIKLQLAATATGSQWQMIKFLRMYQRLFGSERSRCCWIYTPIPEYSHNPDDASRRQDFYQIPSCCNQGTEKTYIYLYNGNIIRTCHRFWYITRPPQSHASHSTE